MILSHSTTQTTWRVTALSGQDLTSQRRYEILRLRRQFNDAVDDFNRKCVPQGWAPWTQKFAVGPTTLFPGTPLLDDFYGR